MGGEDKSLILALWFKRVEAAGISERFCRDAASGTIMQVNASTSPIKIAHAATISVFNQKFLSR